MGKRVNNKLDKLLIFDSKATVTTFIGYKFM